MHVKTASYHGKRYSVTQTSDGEYVHLSRGGRSFRVKATLVEIQEGPPPRPRPRRPPRKDKVAFMLEESGSLDANYTIAARELGVPESELRARYAGLNPGMQRMNLGNRIRAAMKRGGRGG